MESVISMSKNADLIRKELLRAMPFTVVENIDVTNTNYAVPKNICVCDIKCGAKGTVKIDSCASIGKSISFEIGETQKIAVKKIYRIGTDANCRNKITIYGHREEDMCGSE